MRLQRRTGTALGLAVLLGGSGLAGDRRAPAADPELRKLKPGVFLYGAPHLKDPNFAQTVVLLIEHGEKGALGLVIDRPSDLPVAEVLGESIGLPNLSVYWGGPVQPEAMFGLIRTDRPGDATKRVLEGVYMTGSRVELEAAARGARAEERVRIYLGYAGWGAGQLEAEVRAGGWLLAPGEAAAVFSTDPEGLWQRAYQLLERLEVLQRREPATRFASGRTRYSWRSASMASTVAARRAGM